MNEQTPNNSLFSTITYWENRYESGRDSGAGSHGKIAEFKAEILNKFIKENNISSIIDFGCGDGRQISLGNFPNYLGFDTSQTAISLCKERFKNDKNKIFKHLDEYCHEKADLTISIDVIFHLIEEDLFEKYLKRLFSAANRFIIIYSSDIDLPQTDYEPHIKHRKFTTWIKNNQEKWNLVEKIKNIYPFQPETNEGSFSDFFIYRISL